MYAPAGLHAFNAQFANCNKCAIGIRYALSDQTKSRRYGKCLVEREIGRGARATVYLAWHESLQIPVAVKVITKENALDDDHFSERFMREARIAAQLSHSNMVRVYDCGESDTEYYLVMEYVEGESCKEKMEQWGAFDWQRAVQIIRQVAEGLRYANRKGIIHRDIKPENIMIGTDGDARLADLGLAKQVVKGRGSATADGDVLGTPYYMSPEQVKQPSDVDYRSDVYSLGATLYHMTCGDVPFEAPTPYQIMTMHLNEPLTPLIERRPDIPKALSDLVGRAMSKDPEDRYQSYDELIGELDALLDGTAPQSDASEDIMGPVEASLAESAIFDEAEPPSRPVRRVAKPRPELRPVRPVELPVTSQNVTAKLLGLLGLLSYASCLVCGHYLVLRSAGTLAAMAALGGALLLSVGWGYLRVRRPAQDEEPGAMLVLDDALSSTLGRLCERLDLPTPSIHVGNWYDSATFSYSFFSQKARLHLPKRWLAAGVLSDAQREAYLAQALAPIYTGDSDMRTLLAIPVELLNVGRRAVGLVLKLADPLTPRGQEWLVQGLTLAGLAGACAAIALLFASSLFAGILGLGFVVVLLCVSAWERSTCFVGDSFAATVVENQSTVKAEVATLGIASVEGRRLLLDSAGRSTAEQWTGGLPSPRERQQLVEGVVAYYSEVEFSPGTLEMASRLLSVSPFAADRLNRLAGIPRRRSKVMGAALTMKKAYAGLLGTGAKRSTCMLDLSGTGLFAFSGAIAGLLSVAFMALLVLGGSSEYGAFVGSTAILAFGLGLVLAPPACRHGVAPGRMGWDIIVAGAAFACTAMMGYCLFGGATLSRFAVQYPMGFVLVLIVEAVATALYVRLGPSLGLGTQSGTHEAGSRTTQTLIISLEEQRRGIGQPAAPDEATEEEPSPPDAETDQPGED